MPVFLCVTLPLAAFGLLKLIQASIVFGEARRMSRKHPWMSSIELSAAVMVDRWCRANGEKPQQVLDTITRILVPNPPLQTAYLVLFLDLANRPIGRGIFPEPHPKAPKSLVTVVAAQVHAETFDEAREDLVAMMQPGHYLEWWARTLPPLVISPLD